MTNEELKAENARLREALREIYGITGWAGKWALSCCCKERIPLMADKARAALSPAPPPAPEPRDEEPCDCVLLGTVRCGRSDCTRTYVSRPPEPRLLTREEVETVRRALESVWSAAPLLSTKRWKQLKDARAILDAALGREG